MHISVNRVILHGVFSMTDIPPLVSNASVVFGGVSAIVPIELKNSVCKFESRLSYQSCSFRHLNTQMFKSSDLEKQQVDFECNRPSCVLLKTRICFQK